VGPISQIRGVAPPWGRVG